MKKEVPVAAAVIFADDKVLAVQRGYGPGTGWWEFPGGKLEAGETHREALVRELEEELSIKVAVEEEIGTQKSVTADACYVITFFTCRLYGQKPVFREAMDARWLTLAELRTVHWMLADWLILEEVRARMSPATVLCYGDSNTYGYNPNNCLRFLPRERWTGRLSARLGEEWLVVEEGCNGRTAAARPADDAWKYGLDYLVPCLNSHKPVAWVILMLGTNDLKKDFHQSAESIAAGVRQMVETIQEFTAKKQEFPARILLISPPKVLPGIAEGPFNERFEADAVPRQQAFAGLYRQIADDLGCVFLDAAECAEVSELDCLHLSANGHAALSECIAKTLWENL